MQGKYLIALAGCMMTLPAAAAPSVLVNFEDAAPGPYDEQFGIARVQGDRVLAADDPLNPFDTQAAIGRLVVSANPRDPNYRLGSFELDIVSLTGSATPVTFYWTYGASTLIRRFMVGDAIRLHAFFLGDRYEFVGNVAFDNYAGYEVFGVPEPATWAMLIAGTGAIGGSLRRRREAPATA